VNKIVLLQLTADKRGYRNVAFFTSACTKLENRLPLDLVPFAFPTLALQLSRPSRRNLLKPKIYFLVSCYFGFLATVYPNFLRSLAQAQETTPNASRTVRRLPPSAFPNLPLTVRKLVEAHGCEIPQEAFDDGYKVNNVIVGEFAQKGQKDWAILCSKGGNSSILVFWGNPTPCPSELRAEEDSKYLQGDGTGRFVYSRGIRAVNGAQLRDYADPPPARLMKHQGIEDAFTGKASTVVYCVDGKWKEIAAAD
jgi:hypothetical protein